MNDELYTLAKELFFIKLNKITAMPDKEIAIHDFKIMLKLADNLLKTYEDYKEKNK